MKIYTHSFILTLLGCSILSNASDNYSSLSRRRPQRSMGSELPPLFKNIFDAAKRSGQQAAEDAQLNRQAYIKACIYLCPILCAAYAAQFSTTPTEAQPNQTDLNHNLQSKFEVLQFQR